MGSKRTGAVKRDHSVHPTGRAAETGHTEEHQGHGKMANNPLTTQPPLSELPAAREPEMIGVRDGARMEMPLGMVRKAFGETEIRGFSYAGSIPGPIIRARQGSTIDVRLKNNTGLDTTLHPHGVRLDNRFDGIPDVTQPPVQPGEEFSYKIKFRDAGVYWYHPHIRSWIVRELGAYGVFLVEPRDPNYYNPVNREEILMLDDISIEQGEVAGVSDPDHPTHVLMGHFGNTMLVNGQTDYSLSTKKGDVVRFHLLNAADARPFNLSIPGAKMKVVASDLGKVSREEFTDSVLIAPAERYSIEVLFENPGEHEIITKTPGGTTTLAKVNVSDEPAKKTFHEEFHTQRTNRDVQMDIDQFRPHFGKPVDERLVMSLTMSMGRGGHSMGQNTMGAHDPAPDPQEAPGEMPNMSGGMAHGHAGDASTQMASSPGSMGTSAVPLWARTDGIEWDDTMPDMNAASTPENVVWKLVDPKTGAENMAIHWHFKQGDVTKIELFNDPTSPHPMQHPIHFHGQRFLVLDVNGETNPNLQWKDTVLVRPGERVQILMDNDNPGKWMFHCHILRHGLDGPVMRMMGYFNVEPPSTK